MSGSESSSYESDSSPVIVIDNGSGHIKAGYAQDCAPRVHFPPTIRIPLHRRTTSKPYYCGRDEPKLRRGSKKVARMRPVENVIERGFVRSWDSMERLWKYAFKDVLRGKSEAYPVLLTESPTIPKRDREKSVMLMFELFDAPATYMCNQAMLSLYATGNTTGVVVESGHGVTHTVPIFEGYAQSHAIQRLNVAGSDLTQSLLDLLKTKCYLESCYIPEYFELNVAVDFDLKHFKEVHCFVAEGYNREVELAKPNHKRKYPSVKFELPDGQVINIGAERFRCAERLFNPSLIDGFKKNKAGIHKMVHASALACHDADVRRAVRARTILGGGTTMFPGLAARLTKELRRMRVFTKVRKSNCKTHLYSAFVGGCLLSLRSDFEEMCISAEEYEEEGTRIVHRKCF